MPAKIEVDRRTGSTGKRDLRQQDQVWLLLSWHTTRAVERDRVGGWGYKCEHRWLAMSPIDAPKNREIGRKMAEIWVWFGGWWLVACEQYAEKATASGHS